MRSLLPASGFAVLGRGGGEKNPPGSPCLPTYLAAGGSVKNPGVPLDGYGKSRPNDYGGGITDHFHFTSEARASCEHAS